MKGQFLTINEPVQMLVDGEPEAKRMRWMIGARDRMEKVGSIGVFFEGTQIVVAIPLLETSEGSALDVQHAADVIGRVAVEVLNEVIKKSARRMKAADRRAKRAAP